MEAKKEAQSIKKMLHYYIKLKIYFFPQKMKNITSDNTTRPPVEKIIHTRRYSVRNTAAHALPNGSIRQYRIRNSMSLLECFCAKFCKAMTQIPDKSKSPLCALVGEHPRQHIRCPQKPLSH